MKRICAWCKKDLGSSDTSERTGNAPITHGICGDCARKTLSFEAQPLRKFLDQFYKPVFLVNGEGRILTGNSMGLALLQKKPEEIDGELGGDAFGCRHAKLPGGCGNTVHCKTCTIRITVLDTLQSGKSSVRIPAYPDLHHITGENRIRFLISTERIGEAVLLRIDDVAEEDLSRQDPPADADKPRG
jgi:PAS domain-containing protein